MTDMHRKKNLCLNSYLTHCNITRRSMILHSSVSGRSADLAPLLSLPPFALLLPEHHQQAGRQSRRRWWTLHRFCSHGGQLEVCLTVIFLYKFVFPILPNVTKLTSKNIDLHWLATIIGSSITGRHFRNFLNSSQKTWIFQITKSPSCRFTASKIHQVTNLPSHRLPHHIVSLSNHFSPPVTALVQLL